MYFQVPNLGSKKIRKQEKVRTGKLRTDWWFTGIDIDNIFKILVHRGADNWFGRQCGFTTFTETMEKGDFLKEF